MAKAREVLTIYYDPEEKDLKGMIRQLAGKKGTRFENRSMSDIARMVLGEALEKELKKAPAQS